MAINKSSIYIGLGVAGAFSIAAQFVAVKQVPPPTAAQCEAASEAAYIHYSRLTQGNPTNEQRRDYLKTNADRQACLDQSKAGPSLALALK